MQNKTGIIYKLTFPNGKSYIGLTRNSLEKRFIGHCTKAKTGSIRPLYNAIRKYGRESVDVTVIASALVTDLAELEIQLIREHNTLFPNGYNLHSGADCKNYLSKQKFVLLPKRFGNTVNPHLTGFITSLT